MEHYQKLILVTHRQQTPVLEYLELIKECAAEGITAVQLREKEVPLAFLLEFGTRLKEVLSPFNIPLIVNDSIDLAKKLDAEGVHVGNSDGDPAYARRVLGPEKIIGVSLETMDDLKAANRLEGRLYVAASSVFATKNKNNLKTIWGLAGLQNLVKHSRHPVLAIGGVTDVNVYEVLKTGASGIAVIGAIHEAYDPAKATRDLRKILDQHFTQRGHNV